MEQTVKSFLARESSPKRNFIKTKNMAPNALARKYQSNDFLVNNKFY